ncbi:hypothetical protein BV25DRAFT_822122 [Artomyces pyxidatus]|uniref:Uncharacterized protein n=1 Tax=Artomyces pyxidatus TaxID=48021 RepID=A0ACB8SXW4_9AGAM|nr:hypothetical protein BV25DRAFT_822122 [Artomyces pyxidatus]
MSDTGVADYTGAPFDKATSDFILRSSDGKDFRVFSAILSVASPIFRDMLALPRGPGGTSPGEVLRDGLPVVQVTEDAEVLHMMLAFCYTFPLPPFDDLRRLSLLLDVADKYEMEFIKTITSNCVVANITPFAVDSHYADLYALGWRHSCKALALHAARQSLGAPVSTVYAEKIKTLPHNIQLDAYLALENYREAFTHAAVLAF